MAATKRRGVGGRPRLNRDRHTFNPTVEVELVELLSDQAATVQMQLAPYMELLVAEAHGYHGEYLAQLSALPARVSAHELRESVSGLSADALHPIAAPGVRKTVRLDRPLAEEVQRRCDELDAQYADYLRAIFREATGRTATNPRHDQLAAEIDVRRGEMRLPKAG